MQWSLQKKVYWGPLAKKALFPSSPKAEKAIKRFVKLGYLTLERKGYRIVSVTGDYGSGYNPKYLGSFQYWAVAYFTTREAALGYLRAMIKLAPGLKGRHDFVLEYIESSFVGSIQEILKKASGAV